MLMQEELRSARPHGDRVTIGPPQRELMRELPQLLSVARAILDFAADHGAQPLVIGHLRERYARLRADAEAAADWMQECVATAWLKERADHPERTTERRVEARTREAEPQKTVWPRPIIEHCPPGVADGVVDPGDWRAWSQRREASARWRVSA